MMEAVFVLRGIICLKKLTIFNQQMEAVFALLGIICSGISSVKGVKGKKRYFFL